MFGVLCVHKLLYFYLFIVVTRNVTVRRNNYAISTNRLVEIFLWNFPRFLCSKIWPFGRKLPDYKVLLFGLATKVRYFQTYNDRLPVNSNVPKIGYGIVLKFRHLCKWQWNATKAFHTNDKIIKLPFRKVTVGGTWVTFLTISFIT